MRTFNCIRLKNSRTKMNRLVLLLVIFMGIHACSEKSEQANENSRFSALIINEMRGIAIDKEGYLYIPDNKAAILYKVSPDGVVTGLRTYPVKNPFDVAVDNNNRIVVCDATNSEVFVLNEFEDAKSVVDNTERLLFHGATTVGFDAAGNLYVGENDVNVVRKITPEGEVSILAGAFKQSGNSEDGIGSDARIRRPRSITVLPSGLIYLADEYTNLIRKITPEGVVTTIAGAYREAGVDDGQGAEARFDRPRGITADSKGNVFVMDTNNNTIRKITPDGMVSTFAGVAGEAGFLDGVGSAARFNGPRAATIDAYDNIFVTDEENYAVRMISPDGKVTTVIAPQIPPVAAAN
jgi:sugar lactone lactonase YvrE